MSYIYAYTLDDKQSNFIHATSKYSAIEETFACSGQSERPCCCVGGHSVRDGTLGTCGKKYKRIVRGEREK